MELSVDNPCKNHIPAFAFILRVDVFHFLESVVDIESELSLYPSDLSSEVSAMTHKSVMLSTVNPSDIHVCHLMDKDISQECLIPHSNGTEILSLSLPRLSTHP